MYFCFSSDVILELSKIVSSFPRDVQPGVGWNLLQGLDLGAGEQVRMLIGSLVVFTDPRPLQRSRFLAVPQCDAAFIVGTNERSRMKGKLFLLIVG